MSPLLPALRDCFHQAAQICKCPSGRLRRDYGLDDFLTNGAQAEDDAPTLVVKALSDFCEGARPVDTKFQVGVLGVTVFLSDFCEGARPVDTKFQVGVLGVTVFLNTHHAKPPGRGGPLQPARDLTTILTTQGVNEAQVRLWVQANFA